MGTQEVPEANDAWSADFKGHVNTGAGLSCAPLTGADAASRFLRGCQALGSTRVHEAKPVFTRLFNAGGLPTRLRTDHGVPCAPNTHARLSKRSAWWGRLGLLPEYIEPGPPQQHGC